MDGVHETFYRSVMCQVCDHLFGLLPIWIFSTMAVWFLITRHGGRQKTQRLPPGPSAWPIIGHLHLLGKHPHRSLQALSLKYGALMQIRLGSVLSVVVSSPDMAREFLKTHEITFASRPQTAAVKYLTYGSSDFSFAPYGPYWKYMRKICMTELLGGRQLDMFLSVRKQELASLMHSIFQGCRDGGAIDVGSLLSSTANNIISRMAMSTRCSGTDSEAEECRSLVKDLAGLTGQFNVGDYISVCKNLDLQGYERQMKSVHKRFDALMEKILQQHSQNNRSAAGEHKDLIDILFSISEDENAEMKLTRENIKAFILDIFGAGTDTSAITTEWALSELLRNPEIMRKAQEEIDNVVGRERIVEESDIPRLPYLQAIVKETLRLHPTGPLLVRESTEDCNIAGYDIPAKTRLFVNVWAIGRDPSSWDSPLEFSPERFLGDGQATDVRGQHFHLIPFGTGRRGCPGTSLALYVVHTALGAMIQCFDWKLRKQRGRDEYEVDMSEGVGLTLPRAVPLICEAIPRVVQIPS